MMSAAPAWPDMPPPRLAPALDQEDRLRALAQSGLTHASDPGMESWARRVRDRLGVPVALVSLVQADQQVFPGLVGLNDPWASARCTPLSHSFCQYVVASAEPLIIEDSREHSWVRDSPALPELGVVAYAGMPLTTGDGQVLGSLCAIDTAPHRWTTAELDTLADLAHGCSMELRLRLTLYDAAQERRHRDELDAELRSAFGRGQTLLAASQWLAQVSTVTDIRVRVSELVSTELAPTYISMVVLGDDGLLHRLSHPSEPPGPEDTGPWSDFELTAALPSATAVRERRVVRYEDPGSLAADYPVVARELISRLGLHAVTVAPLRAGDGRALGSLVLGWDGPRPIGAMDEIVVDSIAGYAAQALGRVQLLEHRISVAHTLQQAMLSELPSVEGLDIGARYLPADAREQVGGDWYDVIERPAPRAGEPRPIAVSVGDIVGHDLRAATVMGQVRSMLRQACWAPDHESPATVITALERASRGVGLYAGGSALLAYLSPGPTGSGQWRMTWTNAGHPPPLLLPPGGGTELLLDHDTMVGYGHLYERPRRDHRITLEPGATLLLYTDGLVERPGRDIDHGTAALRELAATLPGRPAQDIADAVLDTLVTEARDDAVALAITLTDPRATRT